MKSKKKGFTVVELVIVIAVIAVIAAVLIPTFSNVIHKSNLSADKQAVREMNMALAADEALNGNPQDISLVMQILADAGYNSDNWQCLAKGYEVYWYKADNRLILYNASEALVEYPEKYDADLMTSHNKQGFFMYNDNHIKAQQFDTVLGAPTGSGQALDAYLQSAETSGTISTELRSGLAEALDNSELKATLPGTSDDVYIYAAKEVSSSSAPAHASMIMASAGKTADPVLRSNVDGTLKTNLYYLSVVQGEGATPEQIRSAQIEAGNYIYNIFDQITTGRLDPEVSIVLAPGTKIINAPDKEWAPPKIFTGYFGTSDENNPVIVDGVSLSQATGYSQTVSFDGSQGKYYMTGFFGTIYGKTTIENVVFRNFTIEKAGSDFWTNNSDYKIDNKVAESRSTFGIIGGITNKNGNESIRADVTLKNIVVESSVNITCDASGGGLVGYIGSAGKSTALLGDVRFENCHVSAYVTSNTYHQSGPGGYGPVGGIVGFTCRTVSYVNKPAKEHWDVIRDAVSLSFKDCVFDGTIEGKNAVGACIGDVNNPLRSLEFIGTNDFTRANISTKSIYKQCGYVIGSTWQITKYNSSSKKHNSVILKFSNDLNLTESETIPAFTGSPMVSGSNNVSIPSGQAAFCNNDKKSQTDNTCFKYNMNGSVINPNAGDTDNMQNTNS